MMGARAVFALVLCAGALSVSGRELLRRQAGERFDGLPLVTNVAPRTAFVGVRDVAENSAVYSLSPWANEIRLAGGLVETHSNGITRAEVTVRDMNRPTRDRAVTVYYVVPFAKRVRTVHRLYPRAPVPVDAIKDECFVTNRWTGVGRIGRSATMPAIGVTFEGDAEGTAVGLDLYTAAIARLFYNRQLNALVVACDVGLAPECGEVRLGMLRFPFMAADGYRGLWEKYTALYPEAFVNTRVARQGTWLVETKTSTIPNVEDFGFMVKQHCNDTAFDDAHGLLTVHYTDSSTWMMEVPTNVPATVEACLAVAREHAVKGLPHALAWETCAYEDEKGVRRGQVLNEPWFKGISWSMSPLPGLPGHLTVLDVKKVRPADLDSRYAEPFPKGVDGEFVDSCSGYAAAYLDHRRGHFPYAADPLCFQPQSMRVGIYRVSGILAYLRYLAGELHRRGRILMGNGALTVHPWQTPYVDVHGVEVTSVNPKLGVYVKNSAEDLITWRALAGTKPFCLLQNADFDALTYEMSERFFRMAAAYGFFPSHFSSCGRNNSRFFANPDWYEKVRPLYRKYVPVIRRVAEAGWRPVNRTVVADNPEAVVEQFGDPDSAKGCYVTVHNPSDAPMTLRLSAVDGFRSPGRFPELLGGGELSVGAAVALAPGDTKVLEVRR